MIGSHDSYTFHKATKGEPRMPYARNEIKRLEDIRPCCRLFT